MSRGLDRVISFMAFVSFIKSIKSSVETLKGCFTGWLILLHFRHKADLSRLLKLIHNMGGSVVKDVGKKVSLIFRKKNVYFLHLKKINKWLIFSSGFIKDWRQWLIYLSAITFRREATLTDYFLNFIVLGNSRAVKEQYRREVQLCDHLLHPRPHGGLAPYCLGQQGEHWLQGECKGWLIDFYLNYRCRYVPMYVPVVNNERTCALISTLGKGKC